MGRICWNTVALCTPTGRLVVNNYHSFPVMKRFSVKENRENSEPKEEQSPLRGIFVLEH